MIQSPSTAYTAPVQQPYYTQPAPEYNAIKINIVDPKVNAPGAQVPAPVYNYPQSSVYNYPQAQQAPVYYPQVQTAPVQQQGQVIMQQPAAPQQPAPVPAPQVVNQQTVNQVPPSVIEQPAAQAPAQTTAPEATAAPTAPVAAVDVPSFTQRIKSDNLEDVGKAIEEVADIAQTRPAPELLDTDLMEALLGVIGKDSSTLEAPTERQKELRQQVLEGKQLSEADMAEANKITPLEMAERNKQYALFTTAILQGQLIDEFKKTNNVTPDIKDLPGMEQIVLTVKDNPNPMLRASGLAALAYNARPEYKPVMTEIFELSKQDADENVRKVAEEGLAKLATVADAPAQAA